MKNSRVKVIFILGILLFDFAIAKAQTFSSISTPENIVGERTISVVTDACPTSGDSGVYLYYSNNEQEIGSATCPMAKAKCEEIGNGRMKCTVILPHTNTKYLTGKLNGHIPEFFEGMSPNAEDQNARKLNSHSTVYYQFERANGSNDVERTNVASFKMPRRLRIVNLGDSYSCGEGAPSVSGSKWINSNTHRSKKGGQRLAIKKFINENPGVAVSWKDIGNSGSTTTLGMYSPWHGQDGQIDIVNDWMDQYKMGKIDAVVLAIGGNDVGFAPLIAATLNPIETNPRLDTDFPERFAAELVELKLGYENLDQTFDNDFKADHVFIMEYPDLSRNDQAQFCNPTIDPFDCLSIIDIQANEADYSFAYHEIITPLNNTIEESAAELGWTYMDGTMDLSRRNGVCNCEESYFNTLSQSRQEQGDYQGAYHPNRDGQRRVIKPIVYEHLAESFTRANRAATGAKEAGPKLPEFLVNKQLKLSKQAKLHGLKIASNSKAEVLKQEAKLNALGKKSEQAGKQKPKQSAKPKKPSQTSKPSAKPRQMPKVRPKVSGMPDPRMRKPKKPQKL